MAGKKAGAGFCLVLAVTLVACSGSTGNVTSAATNVVADGDNNFDGEIAGGEFVPGASLRILSNSQFQPGTHRTHALGTPISFEAEEPFATQEVNTGIFTISGVDAIGPGDDELTFLRPAFFSEPAQPNSSREDQSPWPVDDIDGWLENLHDGVIASDAEDVSVAGLPAIYVELQLGDIECGFAPGSCVGFAENGWVGKTLDRDTINRIWVVDQPEDDPLVIVMSDRIDDSTDWFDRADAVLATLGIGAVEPNPVTDLSTAPHEVDVFGGIEFTPPGDQLLLEAWSGRGLYVIPVDDLGIVEILDTPFAGQDPIANSDDLVGILEAAGVDLTEQGGVEIDGVEVRVFDAIGDGSFNPAFRASADDFGPWGWEVPLAAKVWIVDHPDRGLQVMSAKAFEDPGNVLPPVIEWAEELIATISYVETN